VNAVLGVFARLSAWWKANTASVESKMMSLTLLVKLILVDSSLLSNSQHPAFATVWSMYTGLLTDRSTTLAFKVGDIILCRYMCVIIVVITIIVGVALCFCLGHCKVGSSVESVTL